MVSSSSTRTKVFISYSHKDAKYYSGSGILDTEEKQLEQVYSVQEEGPTP